MKFSEKLKAARKEAGMTQPQLAKAVGVSVRTIASYETDDKYPRKRETYYLLADALNVDAQYLLSEDEDFIVKVSETYGSRGARQAEKLISDMSALYAGGELSEEDKDTVMKALQDIYWESKARNAEKYTPKKYKKES